MKNGKRIQSVTIKRVYDESPDTFCYGEYSYKPNSAYSIDRAHTLDCQSLEHIYGPAVDQLQRIYDYLNSESVPSEYYEAYLCAEEIVEGAQETAQQCDCYKGGSRDSREYRYFNPNYENYTGCTEDEIRKYCAQDFDRMEDLNSGQWHYLGIKAEATILVPCGTAMLSNKITSGGLYGIESDSDKCEFDEVEAEQLAELKDQLKALGFSSRAIATAFKTVEHKEEY